MKNLTRSFAVIGLLITTLASWGQYDPSKVSKKAVQAYEQGIAKAQDGQFKEALLFFEEALRRDNRYAEAYLSIAGVYGQMKDYGSSVGAYEKAFAVDSNYTADFRLPYSINLAGMGQFGKALSAIESLLTRPSLNANTRKAAEFRKNTYLFALEYERTHPDKKYVFAPANMGSNINSTESEYFPSMPIEGGQMIFTRRLNNYNEDFFGALREEGNWGPSRRLTGSINTPQNEGAQNISQDGRWLVFNGCNREDGYGSCDIYISYMTNNGWSEAINLGKQINSESWDVQPCLSPDKRDLYFVSNRPGGFGGSDIYVSHLQPNGKWSQPENMGPSINTAGNESSPFIHADNLTLYFNSTGLPGYGESDLYLARRGNDGKWVKPENLGYPINTIDHEGTVFIAADGKTAYYASNRSDSKGGLDIYTFELREDVRPTKTLWIKGKVFDNKTKAGLPSTVELTDLSSKQIISRVQTDEEGAYLITLPIGRDYAFNVNRRGYLFYSDNYSLKSKNPDSTYQKDIALQPIEVNASIVLHNIFFESNQFALKEESQVELDKVVQLLQDNPTVKIQIEGHTDIVGAQASNQTLSENRAKSVVQYLAGKGIPVARLVAKGFGASKPIADNKTEEGKAKNRRTELKIVAR